MEAYEKVALKISWRDGKAMTPDTVGGSKKAQANFPLPLMNRDKRTTAGTGRGWGGLFMDAQTHVRMDDLLCRCVDDLMLNFEGYT
jgi:hypothetical protein